MQRLPLLAEIAVSALALAACGPHSNSICDGAAINCDRHYNQVTFAAAHDSFAYAAGGNIQYSFPNQDRPIAEQLEYGIRTFGIRPCPSWGADTGTLYVTHNYDTFHGDLGGEPLLNILATIKSFLEANPTEIVSLLEEDSGVTSAQVAAVFTQAGLIPYLYIHDASKGWPTLREMAARGSRLVLFTSNSPAQPWQLPMWSFIVDTDYNVTEASQFSCEFYRGVGTNDLYFINQFIYRDDGHGVVLADPQKALIANDPAAAYARALGCWQAKQRIPNFLYVDYFLEGDIKQAVDRLNALPRSCGGACVD